eukprot:4623175-Pleurochrysis_carterae.AAC.1
MIRIGAMGQQRSSRLSFVAELRSFVSDEEGEEEGRSEGEEGEEQERLGIGRADFPQFVRPL